MENLNIVINKNGKQFDPQEYLESKDCLPEFAILIKREALNIGVDRGVESMEKPKYLYYANKMGFDWEQNSDVGFVSYDYKANLIKRLVQDYARILVNNIGFPVFEVSGSNMFNLNHPVVQAYAKLYGDRLYQFNSGDNELVMSYDASYPQFNLAGKYQLSYKNLPFAHFSSSDCYRHEQSGECSLLYRQRRFYMPDLHPYFKDIEEAFEWYPKIEQQIMGSAKEVNRQFQVVVEVASISAWEKYQEDIVNIALRSEQDILVLVNNDEKERYWILNVDYKIIDNLEQSREIGCIQIDVENAKRLGISYIDSEGQKANPIIIHSAVPGGIERYLYMLYDNFVDSFPLWLHPIQIRLLPVSENFVPFCEKIIQDKSDLPIRFDIDDRNERVGNKVRQAHEDLIPYSIVIGEKELEAGSKDLDEAISKVIENAKGKPFIRANFPNKVSLQLG